LATSALREADAAVVPEPLVLVATHSDLGERRGSQFVVIDGGDPMHQIGLLAFDPGDPLSRAAMLIRVQCHGA